MNILVSESIAKDDWVNRMSFVKKSNAMVFLVLNAVMWGSTYVWSKMLLSYLPRFSILFLCSLGGIISTYILFHRQIKAIPRASLLPSLIVSSFSILSNTFFMLALQHTSSSNTAFIVQMSVIFTPLLVALSSGRMPQKRIFGSAFTALAGLFLITCDFNDFHINVGDLLAVCNALFFSLFLTGQNRILGKVDPVHFSFIHHISNAFVFAALACVFEVRGLHVERLASPVFAALISVNILFSVVTVLFQSVAIKHVKPEHATLIYTLEPVTTLILAWNFMNEQPDGLKSAAGCLLILAAIALSVCKPFLPKAGAPRLFRKELFSERTRQEQ